MRPLPARALLGPLSRGCLPLALLLAPACEGGPAVLGSPSPAPEPPPMTAAMTVAAPAEPATPAPAPVTATRAEVVLVELGPPFPADLRTAVEEALEDELAVEVIDHPRIPLPRAAWYAPRKRWRADVLLDHLLTLLPPQAPASTRVLGLTTRDISTTKGEHHDWGVFGLGLLPGQAAVISSHRLRRGAKDREQLRFRVASTAVHEVGHTLGLDHCPEARCPMQDAQGGIENTDSSTGRLGPECRAKLEAEHPLRGPS